MATSDVARRLLDGLHKIIDCVVRSASGLFLHDLVMIPAQRKFHAIDNKPAHRRADRQGTLSPQAPDARVFPPDRGQRLRVQACLNRAPSADRFLPDIHPGDFAGRRSPGLGSRTGSAASQDKQRRNQFNSSHRKHLGQATACRPSGTL